MRSTNSQGTGRDLDFAALRDEARRIGRRGDLVFRVLFALVTGTFLTILAYTITGALFGLDDLVGDTREEYLLHLSAGISWFVGGFFSGWVVEFEVRHRRWRFLWLAVASPAMPTWLFAVWGAATRGSIRGFDSILVIVKVLAAFLGSAAGYWVGYLRRMWWRRKWAGASGDSEGDEKRMAR